METPSIRLTKFASCSFADDELSETFSLSFLLQLWQYSLPRELQSHVRPHRNVRVFLIYSWHILWHCDQSSTFCTDDVSIEDRAKRLSFQNGSAQELDKLEPPIRSLVFFQVI